MLSIRRAAALLLTCLLALTGLTARAHAEPADNVYSRPKGIPLAATEVPNIGKGQYLHFPSDPTRGRAGVPGWWPANDTYERYYWSHIETAPGRYDFGPIDDAIADARRRKARFSFLIMPVCHDCGTDARGMMPQYLQDDPRTWKFHETWTDDKGVVHHRSTPVPDWNSEAYLRAMENLIAEMGRRYDTDPNVGPLEIPGYGNYGEWHTWPFDKAYPIADPRNPASPRKDITAASADRLIRAFVKAFPHKYGNIHTVTSRPYDANGNRSYENDFSWSNQVWRSAMTASDRIGVRNACLGAGWTQDHAIAGLNEGDRYARAQGFPSPLDRWRTAPFTSEYCGGTTPDLTKAGRGSFHTARDQVYNWHVSTTSNANFTGTYRQYPKDQQTAFIDAAKAAGYRYRLDGVEGVIPANGTARLTATWTNLAVAPTYDDWTIQYVLRRTDTWQTVGVRDSALRLRDLKQGSTSVTDTFSTRDLQPGSYALYVRVVDPRTGHLPPQEEWRLFAPMNLSIDGRESDGVYPLGWVDVR